MVALGLRDAAGGRELVGEIKSLGRRALALQMDVTRLPEIEGAVQRTLEEFGRIDILVNNAGVARQNAAEHAREQDFDLTCAVNLKGTFFTSRGGAGDDCRGATGGSSPQLAGGGGGASRRGRVLHDQGGHRPPHQVPAVEWDRHGIYGQCRRSHVHPHPGKPHARWRIPTPGPTCWRRIAALHCVGEPMEVARRRALSRFACRVADHRRDAADRGWVDSALKTKDGAAP
jgi:short chain dehydrogenase